MILVNYFLIIKRKDFKIKIQEKMKKLKEKRNYKRNLNNKNRCLNSSKSNKIYYSKNMKNTTILNVTHVVNLTKENRPFVKI